MILDLSLLAVIIIFALLGLKRGIAKALLNLASVILSGFCAYYSSSFVSDWIYSTFMAPEIRNSITATLTDGASGSNNAFQNLPDFMKGLLGFFGVNAQSFNSTVHGSVETATDAATMAMRAIVVPVLSMLLLILFFIVLLIVFKWLSRKLLPVFRIPVIKQVNKILGGAFGVCEGFIICIIFIIVCAVCIPLVDNFFISPELIESSKVFKGIYHYLFNMVVGI